jgi:hypothetical protein
MVQIKQTEDKELLDEILKQLKENNNICPCIIHKDQQQDKHRCMCEAFRETVSSSAPGVYECYCGRYIATITEED